MRYPNCESKDRREKERQAETEAEARLYAEAESYSEFSLKRAALGIRVPKLFFLDGFRMHYFYSNGREWLYYSKWPFQLCMMLSAVGAVAMAVALAVAPASRPFAVPVFSAAAVGLACSEAYFLSSRAAEKARSVLRDVSYSKYKGI